MVIPAFNEAELLPRLLRSLAEAAHRYSGGAAAIEVIVADNDSSDRTATVAAELGARVVHIAKRAIAAARNGGGRAARGNVLCFVDADMQVHPQTFNVIDRTLNAGRAVAGATGVTSERWSPGIAVTWAAMLPLVWLTRMDTGVVFCRRDDFEAIGGYNEQRLYAEDVEFLLALRRHGRATRRRLARPRGAKAIASSRKFDQHGDWHMLFTLGRVCWHHLFAPERAEKAARAYWYDVR